MDLASKLRKLRCRSSEDTATQHTASLRIGLCTLHLKYFEAALPSSAARADPPDPSELSEPPRRWPDRLSLSDWMHIEARDATSSMEQGPGDPLAWLPSLGMFVELPRRVPHITPCKVEPEKEATVGQDADERYDEWHDDQYDDWHGGYDEWRYDPQLEEALRQEGDPISSCTDVEMQKASRACRIQRGGHTRTRAIASTTRCTAKNLKSGRGHHARRQQQRASREPRMARVRRWISDAVALDME